MRIMTKRQVSPKPRTRERAAGYQIEVAVETAAESPGLVAVAAEVDEPHA